MNRIKQLHEQRGAKLKEAAALSTDKAEDRSKIEALHTEIEGIDEAIILEARQLSLEHAKGPKLSRQEERDTARFDFSKFLNHLHRSAKGAFSGSIDGVEAEMIQEGEREARAAGIQTGGLVLPRILVRRGNRDDIESRDLTATGTTSVTGDQGGMTIATDKKGLLDDFFNSSIMSGMGSTRLEGLVGNLDLPRLVAATDPAKKAENAAADEVSPTTAMLSLSPKRLPAYIDISERLLLQSSSAIEAVLRTHLNSQMGAVREKSFWHGGGTNEPTGIAGTSGIGSVAGGTNGLAPTYAHLVALEEQVDAQNALLGNLYYASNGQIRKKLKTTLENPSGTDATWILKNNVANGYGFRFSNAISRTLTKGTSTSVASAIFFGNFADFIEAYWSGIAFEMVRDKTNAISGLYTLVASTYYDGGVIRPKSFAAMLDALGA